MAHHRHKRDTNARSIPRAALVAAPLAVLATASAVTLGVVSAQPPVGRELMATTGLQASVGDAVGTASGSAARGVVVTRGSSRREKAEQQIARAEKQVVAERREEKATRAALAAADTRLWTTEELNLWSAAGADAVQLGVVDAGERLLVTGREQGERAEVVVEGQPRWVSAAYLDDEKPVAGVGGTCTNGTSVPSGVSPNVSKVHAAVCAAFPQITSYGTFRGDGEHAQGIAVDIMVSGSLGWEIAEFIRANHAELGVSYLIYAQKIWSVERGGEGWRGMSDRGSTTANHYDHVHVTTY